jgi:hypothetical protein
MKKPGSLLFIITLLITFTGCFEREEGCMDYRAKNYDPDAEKEDGSCIYKKKGCTDEYAINFDPAAEENDGTCAYLSGDYSVVENCLGSAYHYDIMVSEIELNFTIFSLAQGQVTIEGKRNGLSLVLHPESNVYGPNWEMWDFEGGSGTISADGKVLSLSYTFSDTNHGNFYGTIHCTATATK